MLEKINGTIDNISDMNLQIAAAAEEQSATSEEINRNTTSIRDISNDVGGAIQRQVENAERMKNKVNEQDQLLNQFKV